MIYGVPTSSFNTDTFLNSMLNKEKMISVGMNSEGEKSAVIGIPFEITLNDGRKSAAIVGRMPIEYISKTLSPDDKDALMYSFVIHQDGDFVVRSVDEYRNNYFERVRAIYEKVERETGRRAIYLGTSNSHDEQGGLLRLVYNEWSNEPVYCSSLPSSEWYLLTILPYGPLNEPIRTQGHEMFFMSMGSCLLILAALTFIFLKYLKINHASYRNLRRQNRQRRMPAIQRVNFSPT